MPKRVDTASWLIIESREDLSTDYAGLDEEAELPPNQEALYLEAVRRIGAEHGFPLSTWVPTLPSRARR